MRLGRFSGDAAWCVLYLTRVVVLCQNANESVGMCIFASSDEADKMDM